MHDIPYVLGNVGPEIVSSMTVASHEVKKVAKDIPVGVQILAGANKEALSVAQAANLQFIRAEGFAFAHVADEGLMNGCAGPLLRYRRSIGAKGVQVFTDVKKKHSSHAITSDISIEEYARGVEFFCGDGVIVTGTETGKEASVEEIESVGRAVSLPVMVGSGVSLDNVNLYFGKASGIIIGSYFKENGNWKAPVEEQRVKLFMEKISMLRRGQSSRNSATKTEQ